MNNAFRACSVARYNKNIKSDVKCKDIEKGKCRTA